VLEHGDAHLGPRRVRESVCQGFLDDTVCGFGSRHAKSVRPAPLGLETANRRVVGVDCPGELPEVLLLM
jgi:hypothetical protein